MTTRQCILGRPNSDFSANVLQTNTLAACSTPGEAFGALLLAPTTAAGGGSLELITPSGTFIIPLPAPIVPRSTGLIAAGLTADTFITLGTITPFADGSAFPVPLASQAPAAAVLDPTRHSVATTFAQAKTITNLAGTLRITLTAPLLSDVSGTVELRLVQEPAATTGFSVVPGTTLTATFALPAGLALGTSVEAPFVGTITPFAIGAGDRIAAETVVTAASVLGLVGISNFSVAASYNAA